MFTLKAVDSNKNHFLKKVQSEHTVAHLHKVRKENRHQKCTLYTFIHMKFLEQYKLWWYEQAKLFDRKMLFFWATRWYRSQISR